MNTNLTPTDLSKALSGNQVETPVYNWNTQERHIVAGPYTSNSTQTFNGQGEPSDSRGDRND
jgi:hypothetical protein